MGFGLMWFCVVVVVEGWGDGEGGGEGIDRLCFRAFSLRLRGEDLGESSVGGAGGEVCGWLGGAWEVREGSDWGRRSVGAWC